MSQEFLSTTSFKNITDLVVCAARSFSNILHKEFECPTFSASCAQGNLGVVYYNFPHAGAVSGFFDGQLLSVQHACVASKSAWQQSWRHNLVVSDLLHISPFAYVVDFPKYTKVYKVLHWAWYNILCYALLYGAILCHIMLYKIYPVHLHTTSQQERKGLQTWALAPLWNFLIPCRSMPNHFFWKAFVHNNKPISCCQYFSFRTLPCGSYVCWLEVIRVSIGGTRISCAFSFERSAPSWSPVVSSRRQQNFYADERADC